MSDEESKKKNTGKGYESLTETVFKQILEQDSVKTLKIKKNVTLQGRSTKHEIDVYWEFEIGGQKYIHLVQAKDWGQNVKQEQIMTFNSVINDIPGRPRGIFVTKTGYQKGAIAFAKANDINLYELREPTEKDWKGRVKTIILNIFVFPQHYKLKGLNVDQVWLNSELKNAGIADGESLPFDLSAKADEFIFFDDSNNEMISFFDIYLKLMSEIEEAGVFKEIPATDKTYSFTQNAYLKTGLDKVPRIKVKDVTLTLSITKESETLEIKGEGLVSFILKETFKDQIVQTFDKDIKLRKKPDVPDE